MEAEMSRITVPKHLLCAIGQIDGIEEARLGSVACESVGLLGNVLNRRLETEPTPTERTQTP